MATESVAASLPDLTYDAETWIDLEIQGNIIDNNWVNTDQRGLAQHRASTPSISMDALKIAWKQVQDQSDRDTVKKKKEETFDLIGSFDTDVLKCMYAAYLFARGTKEKYISHYYRQISASVDPEYTDLYDKCNKENRKVGKTLFLYIYNSDLLKDVFTLDHIDRRKPREIGQRDATISNPLNDISMSTVESIVQSDNRDAKYWRSFEYQGCHYITIKRHYRDAVDAQTTQNEEIEQAEYVVLKFDDGTVDIHSEKKTTASTIRNSLGTAYSDIDVEFESAEERKPADHFEDTTPYQIIKDINSTTDYTVTGTLVDNTKFTNNPTLKIQTEDGAAVLPAIRDFRNTNNKFFTEVRNVRNIVIVHDDTTYTLLPKQDSESGFQWYIRYHADGITDTERESFENAIESVLNVRPCFITTD